MWTRTTYTVIAFVHPTILDNWTVQFGKNGKINTSTTFLDVGTEAMKFRVLMSPFLPTAQGMRKSLPLSTPHLSVRLVKVAQSTIFLDVWDKGDELSRSPRPHNASLGVLGILNGPADQPRRPLSSLKSPSSSSWSLEETTNYLVWFAMFQFVFWIETSVTQSSVNCQFIIKHDWQLSPCVFFTRFRHSTTVTQIIPIIYLPIYPFHHSPLPPPLPTYYLWNS